ncbi:hypothetical protein [Alkalicoccus saliphilus]|jgi:hypothetical protein|uniref:hypothetical protein n=1 Tax=Alkalicoccus saliphilus TaxID=200989 RepID=UPI0011B22D98|nr:hypothetical protein [Alkalicoccus saliphilus]
MKQKERKTKHSFTVDPKERFKGTWMRMQGRKHRNDYMEKGRRGRYGEPPPLRKSRENDEREPRIK